MVRFLVRLVLAAYLLSGCGPDKRECSGSHADFVVVLKLVGRPLPDDTVVHVIYGGSATEDYDLSSPARPEVVFCKPADENGVPLEESTAAAGAPGDAPNSVLSLNCQLWTGGFAKLQVRATGVSDRTYELQPREHQCTVTESLELETPDAS